MMHGKAAVAEVLELRRQGLGAKRIARRTGLPLATVRDWLAGKLPRHSRAVEPGDVGSVDCERCGGEEHCFESLPLSYPYLLGMYLGDGCISAGPRSVFRLRIFLDLRYPRVIDECESAIRDLVPLRLATAHHPRGSARRAKRRLRGVSHPTDPVALPETRVLVTQRSGNALAALMAVERFADLRAAPRSCASGQSPPILRFGRIPLQAEKL